MPRRGASQWPSHVLLPWPRLHRRWISRKRRWQTRRLRRSRSLTPVKKVKPILDRVRELQAELAAQTKETREKCVQELNELKREAQAEKAYGPAVSAVMGKAKILNFITENVQLSETDFNSAQSMTDIGRKLLQSMGLREPDDASIAEAVEANDAFIDALRGICERAHSTLEQA